MGERADGWDGETDRMGQSDGRDGQTDQADGWCGRKETMGLKDGTESTDILVNSRGQEETIRNRPAESAESLCRKMYTSMTRPAEWTKATKIIHSHCITLSCGIPYMNTFGMD